MKKNRMMRLASALLVLTLMTTCAISGTFAKYTDSASAADSARVAKWGVEVTVTGTDAFAKAYKPGTDNTATATDDTTATVITSANDKVLAPGTKGTLGTIQVAGMPEVAVDVKVDVDAEVSNWTVDSALYFPVVVKVGTNPVDMTGVADMEAVEVKIEQAIAKAILHSNEDVTLETSTIYATGKTAKIQYTPNNANLADADPITVTWEWPFEGDDVKDTALGNQANSGNAAGIGLSMTVTVTQVD